MSQISVCIPSSVLDHCYNLSQITQCVYQMARALCIYNVVEVVILDIVEDEEPEVQIGSKRKFSFEETKLKLISEKTMLIASLFQYFITPPYLVNQSFNLKQINLFKKAKLLPKIPNLPFMLNSSNEYKEGLSVPSKNKKTTTRYINIGQLKQIKIDQDIPVNVRVTVNTKTAKIVSLKEAYGVSAAQGGFGYLVRVSQSFSDVFTKSGVSNGYTKTVYCSSGEFFKNQLNKDTVTLPEPKLENDKVLLIVGEYNKFQHQFKKDDSLKELDSFKQMCDFQLNIVKGCRIEDAVLVALTKLQV